jgi:hypothetical protein
MLGQNTTIINVDRKHIALIVKQLFDGNIEDIHDEFLGLDPIIFYNETIKEKEKRGYQGKIIIPCNSLVYQSELILTKLEEARKQLTGQQFDGLWDCFEINLDFSIWGSNVWEPRVLPNGSILIRNIQKVIGINEQLSDKLEVRFSALTNDLKELEDTLQNKKFLHEEDTLNFSILHRDENGFIWTRKVPEKLSEVGQTLIFISRDMILRLRANGKLSPNNAFISDKALAISKQSVSEHCVFRVFKYSTLMYGTYRLGDEYDTILESYSYRLGDDPLSNEYIEKDVSTDFNFIKKYIKYIVQNEELEIYGTEVLKHNRNIKVLLADKVCEDYSSKKASQINELKPLFGQYWDRPVSYYGINSQFWNISQLNKGYMFLVNFSFYYLPSAKKTLQDFKETVGKVISQSEKHLKPLLYLPITELSYLNEEDVFEYGTPECDARMELVSKKLSKNPSQTISFEESANYENEEIATKEFLAMSGSEYKVYILFVTPTAPIIEDCHQFGIQVSKYMDNSLTIHVPNYGFNQGYSSGNLDAGNSTQYLT